MNYLCPISCVLCPIPIPTLKQLKARRVKGYRQIAWQRIWPFG